jgi:hypothetical protein
MGSGCSQEVVAGVVVAAAAAAVVASAAEQQGNQQRSVNQQQQVCQQRSVNQQQQVYQQQQRQQQQAYQQQLQQQQETLRLLQLEEKMNRDCAAQIRQYADNTNRIADDMQRRRKAQLNQMNQQFTYTPSRQDGAYERQMQGIWDRCYDNAAMCNPNVTRHTYRW